jgi:hypothetical protein
VFLGKPLHGTGLYFFASARRAIGLRVNSNNLMTAVIN